MRHEISPISVRLTNGKLAFLSYVKKGRSDNLPPTICKLLLFASITVSGWVTCSQSLIGIGIDIREF